MKSISLPDLYTGHPGREAIARALAEEHHLSLRLEGLTGSSMALLALSLFREAGRSFLIIAKEKDDAAYLLNDLSSFTDDENLLFFPSSFRRSARYTTTDPANIVLRTNVLNRLSSTKGRTITITYPEAIMERVISRGDLVRNRLVIRQGDELPTDFLEELLQEYRFTRTDFVYEPGQYAIRGGIVDLFSYAADRPFRLDYFGDVVDSVRIFNPEDQRSEEVTGSVTLIPDIQSGSSGSTTRSLTDFLEKGTVIWAESPQYLVERIDSVYEQAAANGEGSEGEKIREGLLTGKKLSADIAGMDHIAVGRQSITGRERVVTFNTSPQPAFAKNFGLLGDRLRINSDEGYRNLIVSDSEKQLERLRAIFAETGHETLFSTLQANLHAGFSDHDVRIALYTDHQIFDRYHKYRIKGYFTTKESISLREITDLNPGDYVVHTDHGIGRFGGLEKIEVNGKMQEAIKLVYRDNDILYVGIHSLHRISKYKGKDAEAPRIHKLGSGSWQKLKQKTKRKVKEIAADLIKLYAKRLSQPGFSYSPDSYLQHELEASFIYEDTPDQISATSAVKEDMEADHPMDRLICGDVGFGKTEIAVRAAFKAAADGKQTALLVPTTILALQHYKTFRSRLESFPCRIEYISRHRKPAVLKRVLQELAEGSIDIVIGTHKLVGQGVSFKDLGLLIIDEEQRFGVAVKEKIRAMRANIDTLTLTATPIPRTLQFSLMGARDLSVMNTPPPNRVPIVTELHGFNEDIIREGIDYETGRNGQVFFIHNNIETIKGLEETIRRVVPAVKTAVVHGRMQGVDIEQIMGDFIEGDYDVLIATTIVESGLDIPNANTIFINDAHTFGLSELHQLRGRVGRSNRRAFCYLLTPPLTTVTHEARRRLNAIEQHSGLGSGFSIAMQDLDIRGAGNLLGGEQSGFIADIGFETYRQILAEAVEELKEEGRERATAPDNVGRRDGKTATHKTERPDADNETAVHKTERVDADSKRVVLPIKSSDVQVDTDLEIMIPDSYVNNISERIRLYRELNSVGTEEEMASFVAMLKDRFGKVPPETEALLQIVLIKWKAAAIGAEKITIKNRMMLLGFGSGAGSDYYGSEPFIRLMNWVNSNRLRMKVRQRGERLTITVADVATINEAVSVLDKMSEAIEPERG